jgi:hypothetical protein
MTDEIKIEVLWEAARSPAEQHSVWGEAERRGQLPILKRHICEVEGQRFRRRMEILAWEQGGGLQRALRALRQKPAQRKPIAPVAEPKVAFSFENCSSKVRNSEIRPDAEVILSRMNGHPVKANSVADGVGVLRCLQVLRQLEQWGAVRKVARGMYEKVALLLAFVLCGCVTEGNFTHAHGDGRPVISEPVISEPVISKPVFSESVAPAAILFEVNGQVTRVEGKMSNDEPALPVPPARVARQVTRPASSTATGMALVTSPTVTVVWDASPDPSVVGYRVYFGIESERYTNSVTVTNALQVTIGGLVPGTIYYFAATAFDAAGMESDLSNETYYYLAAPAPVTARLAFAPYIFRAEWNGSAGMLQRSTNLVQWVDLHPLPSGSVVLVTNTGAREFLRVKLN